jgi:hypothetical protein
MDSLLDPKGKSTCSGKTGVWHQRLCNADREPQPKGAELRDTINDADAVDGTGSSPVATRAAKFAPCLKVVGPRLAPASGNG